MGEINLIPKEYKSKRLDIGNIFSKTGGIVLALLILSLLVFGGLLLYQNKIKTNLANIKQNILDLEAKRNSDEEAKIYNADIKLNLVEKLFKNHFYWSQLFTKIQDLVVTEVYFDDFKTSFTDKELTTNLNGNAITYTALARQMVSFKEDEMVKSISLKEMNLSDTGGIDFGFTIIFRKEILTNKIETK
jgi:Tfp pilus assembly protein PilN